ncbi:MAG: Gfo/Idh/MocA family oxidoreductase [Acidobacteriota bacterium]
MWWYPPPEHFGETAMRGPQNSGPEGPAGPARSHLRWGVLGTARIAVRKVIPALQRSAHCRVEALASRSLEQARNWAEKLGIPRAYGSYEELLADPAIDVIYNPLPNHLHVPWTARAAAAGKHVLCEKPLACSTREAAALLGIRDRTGVYIQEAFMVRTHPQWLKVRELVTDGTLGRLVAIQGVFSYFNRDPRNVRNVPEFGGGGLLDIGCYPVNLTRFVTGREPVRVIAAADFDPEFRVDRLVSGILDYGDRQSSFVCSMQMTANQWMEFIGEAARVTVEIPFNAPNDRPCRLFLSRGDLFGADVEVIEVPACDQYTIQGDEFARAILTRSAAPIPLEDSLRNMAVLDALKASWDRGAWVSPGEFLVGLDRERRDAP